jgi:transcriptional regulator with XRE-family HTH domain
MPEGFGARLRTHREARHIDLAWIAEETKIKRSLLEGLERDDVSRWPSGIFRRAYVRTYAHTIGLDPDVVLREFLEVHPDPVDVLEAAAAAASDEAARRNPAPGLLLRTIVDSAIGSLARLRRPGAMDGPMPPAPPIPAPARTVVAPPGAPHGAAGPPQYAAELESALKREYAAGSQDALYFEETSDLGAPTQLGAAPELATAAELEEAPEPDTPPEVEEVPELDKAPMREDAWPPPPPALMMDAADDRREQAPPEQDQETGVPAEAAPHERPASIDARVEAVAILCTEFGRAGSRDRILTLLEDSARALDAAGLIVWLWDQSVDALRPTLVHGYSDQVLTHLPMVERDADNATAEAFRTARPCEVAASAQATGALVVPLLIPEGCAGVLAVELQPGVDARGSVRALATLLAAALAQFVLRARPLPGGRTRIALRP